MSQMRRPERAGERCGATTRHLAAPHTGAVRSVASLTAFVAHRYRRRAVLIVALGVLTASLASAQARPEWVQVVPGTATVVGGEVAMPTVVLARDGVAQGWFTVTLVSSVPAGVEVDAATLFADERRVMSFDTSVAVGGVAACDEDLLLYDPSTGWELLFDGSAHGLPNGADVDAVHVDDPGPPLLWCLLSFQGVTTVGGATYLPGDVVRWESGSGFSLEDGAATVFGTGMERVNIDGLAVIDQEHIVLSVAEALDEPEVLDSDLLRWSGSSLYLFQTMSAWGFPESAVGAQAVDVWYPVDVSIVGVAPGVVSTAGAVSASAYAADRDGEPVTGVQCRSAPDGSWVDMAVDPACGNQYCDGASRNGELFDQGALFFAAGLSSTVECRATDGTGWETATAAGPGWVSEPGDADGDGNVDAADVARIIAEWHDDNTSTSIGHVRSGNITDSWGGTDAEGDNGVEPNDVSTAVTLVLSP